MKACTGGAGNSSRASLEAQGTAAAGLELRARLGGGECKVTFWLTPSPAYIEPIWAPEGSLLRLFAIPNEYSLLLACKLKIKIHYYFY